MFSSLKRLTKHSAVYGIGHIVTRIVNFLLLPLYTNELSREQFGAYAVLFTFLAVMFILYTYGLDAAFLRYFVVSEDAEERKRIFSTAFWGILMGALGFSALIFFFSEFWSGLILSHVDYAYLIRLIAIILFFDALLVLPFLFLRAEEKSVLYTSLKFINVIINVVLNIYFIVVLKKGVAGIFLANAWASGLTFVLLGFIVVTNLSFQFDRAYFKELLKFGLPYLPSTLAVVLLDVIDRVLLEKIVGLGPTGIYNAGVKLGMFMALFVAAFRFAWQPFFLATSKEENAREIFSKVMTYFILLATVIFLAISFFIDELVKIQILGKSLIGAEFWPGTKIVPVILLAYLINGIYVNLIVGVYLKDRTGYLPIITGAGVFCNIILNLLLIPKLGIMGAAYAKIVGYSVMCVSLYFFAQRVYTIQYELGRLLKLTAIAGILFYFGYTLNNSWENAIKVLLLLGFPVFLWLSGFFERRELERMKMILGGKLR